MGKRLTKITTKTGDGGTSGLADGSRISKDKARMVAIGDVDELNCCLGLLIAGMSTPAIPRWDTKFLQSLQHRLFDLGGELSMPGTDIIEAGDVKAIEDELDKINKNLKPLENFIIPGGSVTAAHTHLARAVARRAERSVIHLENEEGKDTVNPETVKFLNRLSDYLFVLARSKSGINEVLWEPKPKPTSEQQESS